MGNAKMGVIAAVLLTATAPAALAKLHTAQVTPPPKTIVGSIGPNQMRASKLIGSDVYSMNNRKVGSLKDIVLDRSGRVAVMVLSTHGKNVGLPISDFKASHKRLTLINFRKGQLRLAQRFHLTNKATGAGTSRSPVHGGRLGSGGPGNR